MKAKYNIISAVLLLLMGGFMFSSCRDDGGFDYGHEGFYITDTENNPIVKFSVEDTPASYTVTVQSTDKVKSDVTFSLALDLDKVEEYNATHGTTYFAVPEGSVELTESKVTMKADEAISSGSLVRVLSTEDFVEGRTYIIPVTVTDVKGSSDPMLKGSKTIYLRISRVINFAAINADYRASSNFIFDKTFP